jgi:hypothetical protein
VYRSLPHWHPKKHPKKPCIIQQYSTCVWLFNIHCCISKIFQIFHDLSILISFKFHLHPWHGMVPGSALPPPPSGTLPDYQAMPAMPGVITEAAHQVAPAVWIESG